MATPIIQSPKSIRFFSKKAIWVILTVIIVIMLGTALAFHFSQNPAAVLVKALGNELVQYGAIEECSGGDPGFGPDNYGPHYGASYRLPVDKNQAIALIYKVATANGYKLSHANPSNRGHLSAVADVYIDNWYFDDSKSSTSFDLNPGAIQLAFSVNGSGSKDSCKQTIIQPGHSIIGIGVQLPRRKF